MSARISTSAAVPPGARLSRLNSSWRRGSDAKWISLAAASSLIEPKFAMASRTRSRSGPNSSASVWKNAACSDASSARYRRRISAARATPDASPCPVSSARHISMSDSMRFPASFGHGLILRTERPRSAIDARRSEKKALVMISVGGGRPKRSDEPGLSGAASRESSPCAPFKRRRAQMGPEPTQARYPGNGDAKADQQR